MNQEKPITGRRSFLKKSILLTTGVMGLTNIDTVAKETRYMGSEDLYVIGPRSGYSPQIGTLVSMMNYMRDAVVDTVKKLKLEELDHLHDSDSNTIGALLLHLGATETFYQINTFEGRQEFNESEKKIWQVPMSLGDEGREKIKGHDVTYYLDIIGEVREKTLEEFKNRDDEWLMSIDPVWSSPDNEVNNYWKWFDVCEHESNHRGQIKWLKSRLPGANSDKD